MVGFLKDYMKNQYGRVDVSAVKELDASYKTLGVALKLPTLGMERYRIGNETFEVEAGQMLLMDEGVAFEAHMHAPSPQLGMCIDIPYRILQEAGGTPLEGLSRVMPEIPNTQIAIQSYSLYPVLKELHANLGAFDWEEEGYECIYALATQVRSFLGEITRERSKINVVKGTTRDELYRRLQLAKSYLHDTYQQPFQLRKAAEASMLSEFHLARLFRMTFGCTLFNYHESLRMQKARLLLRSTDTGVADIAFRLGYHDASYFIRRFKKHFGTTPGRIAK